MKRTLLMLSLVVVMLGLGMSQAYAVTPPAIDGAITDAAEWTNVATGGPYPYFLEVTDPDELDNQIQNMDISHAVVLQELNAVNGDGDADVLPPITLGLAGDNDGIYILLEVYGPPPSLAFATGAGVVPNSVPVISMQGDLLGDGLLDPFNIFLRHTNTDGLGLVINDTVDVCVGSIITCTGGGAPYSSLTASGGSFARGSVLEYFIPSTAFGTPIAPFPFNFRGSLIYDNGASGPNTSDDVVVGQLLVPEPSTVFLTVTGLLSMLGFGKFKFWN